MEQKEQEQWEEQWRKLQEEEEEKKAVEIKEEDLKAEMQRMAEEGYQEKVRKK